MIPASSGSPAAMLRISRIMRARSFSLAQLDGSSTENPSPWWRTQEDAGCAPAGTARTANAATSDEKPAHLVSIDRRSFLR